MKNNEKPASFRKNEIAIKFLFELDKHLEEFKSGTIEKAFEVTDFARLLFIAPNHFSDTIKDVLGKSPCAIYEEKLIEISKQLITDTDKSISEIARNLDYDPSNFTKFFKRFTKLTPTEFRKLQKENRII